MKVEQAARQLEALGNPTRLQVYRALVRAGDGGLPGAAHLIERGVAVKIYEAGPTVGANLRDWGHVRIFTPWKYSIDAAAASILRRHGWEMPPADALPTGDELCGTYLDPLAATP